MSERLAGTEENAQGMVGFVGHRDLVGFGEESDLSGRLRRVFLSLPSGPKAGGLLCGYAPGADQLAVRVWNALALPPPRLVFPFAETVAGQGTVFHTDDPAQATAATAFTEDALALVGTPTLPDEGIGHAAQAATILAWAEIIVAIVDETRAAQPGGTVETVARARALGKEVIVIGPDT